MFFIIISALHVSGGFSAHQELINLYGQPWVLSCFPAVYRWCGWVPHLAMHGSMNVKHSHMCFVPKYVGHISLKFGVWSRQLRSCA